MKEVLKLALDALEAVNVNLVCQASHHKKTDGHGVYGICPNKNRHIAAIYAIKEALSEKALDKVTHPVPHKPEPMTPEQIAVFAKLDAPYAKALIDARDAQWVEMLSKQQAEPKYKVTVIDDHHLAGVPLEQWGKQQAEPVQEPVAKVTSSGSHAFPLLEWLSADHSFRCNIGDLLYTSPPQRTWQGLTDEEFHDLQREFIDDPWANFKAIESKLKEKNT